MIFLKKLGIIQGLLQTLNENFQNRKISTIIHINYSVVSSKISMSSIIGSSQVLECYIYI